MARLVRTGSGPGPAKVSNVVSATTFIILILIANQADVASAAKFLLASTGLMNVASHYMGLTSLTQVLVDRGHDVTLLAMEGLGNKGFLPRSYTFNITYPNPKTKEELDDLANSKATFMGSVANMSLWEIIGNAEMRETPALAYFGCFELFKHDDVLARLKAENVDVIISFPVAEFCDAVIAAYLDIKLIVLSGSRRSPAYHEGLVGMPMPNSYVPSNEFPAGLSDQMTFQERVVNFLLGYAGRPIADYFLLYRPIGQLQALHDIRKDLTPQQIVRRADLWLCHHTWALAYPHPTVPSWIPIAGYTIKDPAPLPEHLETFVQGSGEHGFIVFTMGSTASLTSESLTDMFLKVFSALPQRVLWRHTGTLVRNHSSNILISDWLPQNDLLAHPKVRMLIYHGGSAGLHEAIHHAVPLLLIPLAGDQPKSAHLAAAKGMALMMDRNNLVEDQLRTNIHRLIQDPSYKENATRASAILRDRITSPLDTAIFWIEHVVRFGGDHLRVRAVDMGFIELNSLDVAAFLVAISLVWAYVTYLVTWTCCSCISRFRTTKQKND